jgi:NADH-quinone oxidoreductase subunit A
MTMTIEYSTILMVFFFAAVVTGTLLGLPRLLAPRRLSPVKAEPFECGMDPLGIAEGRFAIKFSTVAILFILLDIELLFVWPWAMLFRALGWFGFVEMMVFMAFLMVGFLYIWRKGGLEWE